MLSIRVWQLFVLCSSCYQELFRCPVVGAVPAGSGIATQGQHAGTIGWVCGASSGLCGCWRGQVGEFLVPPCP